jgi:hypothetical protein
MNLMPRKDQLVNLYLDINPITNKPFYVGIGVDSRLIYYKRNKYHQKIVESIPDKKYIRKVIYRNISIEKVWRIEKQIINKCGRLVDKNGYLANIHEGGPLSIEDVNSVHWLEGRKIKVVIPDYINPRAGTSYDDQYGERKNDIIKNQIHNRIKSIKKRIQKNGRTQKEKEHVQKWVERRRNKQYTEKELQSFINRAQNQQGKSMQERLNDPNWIDPRKGKSAKEIYGKDYQGPANKGKTYKELKGQDYIDPRAKTFTIQIDNNDPIFCESERDFCIKFNCNDILLRKFKEHGIYKIKRQSNSKHTFPNNSIVKFNYIK